MLESAVRPALAAAMQEVLERMLFLDSIEAPEAGCAEPAIEARLDFEGQPPGSLALRVPTAAARALAADFLGIEAAGLAEGQIFDVVRELANMICGAALSRLESTAEFGLGPPEIAGGACPPGAVHQTAHSIETAVGVFTAILATESEPCRAAKPES